MRTMHAGDRAADTACGRALEPLDLPGLAPSLAQLSRFMGHGRIVALPEWGPQAGVHVRPCWAASAAPSQSGLAQPTLMLHGEPGPLWLCEEAATWLSGLTGVDTRTSAEPDTLAWLQASTVALLPPPWKHCFHAMAADPEALPEGLVAMRLSVRTHDHVLTTHGWAAANTWLACLAGSAALPRVHKEGAAWQWPVKERVVVARHCVPARRARLLRPGDIVVPAQPLFDSRGVGSLRCGQRLLRVRGHADRLEVLDMSDLSIESPGAEPLAAHESATDEPTAQHQPGAADDTPAPPAPASGAESPADANPRPASALERLPLVLEFSLGCVRSTLGELESLVPGAVLVLERAWAPGCVSVRVGDRELGLGELVQVQGQLAVRLTEWNAP